jgi:hypothetical protein
MKNDKKMKKIVFFILCPLLFSLSACSDFLEIEPLETIVLDKFWNEEADVENVVAECYSSMQSQAVIERMMAWGEFRSDNVVGGTNAENNKDLSNIFKENINASNSFAKWGDFYSVINNCNTIIYYAPQVKQKDPNYTERDLNVTIAEASAIRDLMYFYLIRSFEKVPYTTTPFLDDNQKMDLAPLPFDAVLDSLITDLEKVQDKAVKTYSSTKPYYQHGRITQDAIHAMLADMYLWKQDYRNAVRYADMVIKSKTDDYQSVLDKMAGMVSTTDQMIDGFPLISDGNVTGRSYGTAATDIFGQGNSRESIFELIYMNNDQMLANGAVSTYYGNATTYPGLVKPAEFLVTDVNDEQYSVFLNKYDARFYENMQAVNGSRSNAGIAKYCCQSAQIGFNKVGDNVTVNPVYGSTYAESTCHANWILYRLTDVMLMKAEALVEMVTESADGTLSEQNDTLLGEAFKIVNAIQKRSSAADEKDLKRDDYNSKALMQQLVLDERQRELMFEGKRWYDLVRRARRDGSTATLIGAVSKKGSSGGTAISSKLSRMEALYWPYHNDEMKVNGNLVQNPAFGSGEESSYEKTN